MKRQSDPVGAPRKSETTSTTEAAAYDGDIALGQNAVFRLAPLDGPQGVLAFVDPERTVVIADERTRAFVPEGLKKAHLALVPRGEAAKTLSVAEALYDEFFDRGVDRDFSVVALGGGSVLDLAGFVASTWMRGIDFGYAPTTLLSMLDASIGGKTGLDFRGRKNLIGTFASPRFVLADTRVLSELPATELAGGFAEAVKHAIIDGDEHFATLESALDESGIPRLNALPDIIRRSAAVKARIVQEDPRDEGLRAVLNLGHTFGHAVEAAAGIAHGHAVAVGLVTAFRFAERILEEGRAARRAAQDGARVAALLRRAGLPTTIDEAFAETLAGEFANTAMQKAPPSARSEAQAALFADKKRRGKTLRFVLPRGIGAVELVRLPLSSIADFIMEAP